MLSIEPWNGSETKLLMMQAKHIMVMSKDAVEWLATLGITLDQEEFNLEVSSLQVPALNLPIRVTFKMEIC
jgi:hypothetical protein